MKQDIIINSTISESRIALLEDDVLVELYVERPENERMVGSVYKGIVKKVLPGMSAAFVDIGISQDAFLHFSDVGEGSSIINNVLDDDDDVEKENDNAPEIPKSKKMDPNSLRVGQDILVQVIKEPIGHKGPRVSAQVALPGRSLVLIPYEDYVGVSKKVHDWKERKRLKVIGNRLRVKNFGIILRTLAEGKSEEVLKSDLDRVLQTWKRIEKNINAQKNTGLVYRDMSLASSIIRDLFTPVVNSVVVDSRKMHREIVDYLEEVAPQLVEKVTLYKDRFPIFDKFGIEAEIEKCLQRKIWLNGGGYIYFDYTEALVAIDVNSGRFVGKRDHEENSLKVNLKAAKEICRQLRLRDIGGILIIDFIDMSQETNRRKVFEEMRKALRMDRAKWDIAPIGPFGVMEMTRQRIRPALLFSFRDTCPSCLGTGTVPSMETVVTAIERWVKRFVSKTKEFRLEITLPTRVKTYLSGGINSRIAKIMWASRCYITLKEDENLRLDEFKAYSYKQKREVTTEFLAGKIDHHH